MFACEHIWGGGAGEKGRGDSEGVQERVDNLIKS